MVSKYSPEEGNSFILKNKSIMRGIFVTAIVLGSLSLYYASYKPLLANRFLFQGYKYHIVDYSRAEYSFRKGLNYDTFTDLDYSYQMYSMYINQVSLKKEMKDGDLEKSFRYTTNHIINMIKKYPWSARLYIYLGHINEIAPSGIRLPGKEMIIYLNKAVELAPFRDAPRYMLANIYLEKLKVETREDEKKVLQDNIINVLRDYISVLPDIAEPNIALANILYDLGKKEESMEIFKQGMEFYIKDQTLTSRVIDYYLKNKDYIHAEEYYEVMVVFAPDNLDYHFDLGYLYYLNGKREKAIEKVNYVKDKNPKILERNIDFVNNIL